MLVGALLLPLKRWIPTFNTYPNFAVISSVQRTRFVARINTTPTQHALRHFGNTLANFQLTQGRLRARCRTAFALEAVDSVSKRLS